MYGAKLACIYEAKAMYVDKSRVLFMFLYKCENCKDNSKVEGGGRNLSP